MNIYPLAVRNTINQISLHCYQMLTRAKCNIKVIPINKFSHALMIVQVYSRYFTIKVNNRALHNIFIGYSIYITCHLISVSHHLPQTIIITPLFRQFKLTQDLCIYITLHSVYNEYLKLTQWIHEMCIYIYSYQ